MIGFIAILIATLFTLAASLQCLTAYRRTGDAVPTICGTRMAWGAAAAIVVAAGYFLFLLLTDQFQYKYIWSYSSVELPLLYKISAFWAGQEGSFLLWLLIHCGSGLFLLRKGRATALTMFFYFLLQFLLLALLLVKSPFLLLASPEVDGAGLNPLLQDPWMAIHPPLIFLGYAWLAIPLCYAVGSLFSKDKTIWVKHAIPWTLAAEAVLGAGIFIGGYWAYKVLGWGGYWGWDPVENSSLVPWLIGAALLHFLLIARMKVGALRGAYVCAIAAFGAVLYGTFLTRSGVLGDFSVHSFSDDGIGLALALVVTLVVAVSLFLLTLQWNTIPNGELYGTIQSRAFLMSFGSLLLLLMAVIVACGMSVPLVSGLNNQAQSVAPSFYNKTFLPPSALLLVLLAIVPLVKWQPTAIPWRRALRLIPVIALGILLAVRYSLPDVFSAVALVIFLSAALAIFVFPCSQMGKGTRISHLGLALMAAGIILSAGGSQNVVHTFGVGQPEEIFGRTVMYQGEQRDTMARSQVFLVDGNEVRIRTKLDAHGVDNAKEPGIFSGLTGDLYFSPAASHAEGEEILLDRRKPLVKDDLFLRFHGVESSSMPGSPDNVMMKVLVDVTDGTTTDELVLLLLGDRQGYRSVPVTALNGRCQMMVKGISPDQQQVQLYMNDNQKTQQNFETEVSTKPFVWLVWLGAAAIVLGCLVSVVKTMKQ